MQFLKPLLNAFLHLFQPSPPVHELSVVLISQLASIVEGGALRLLTVQTSSPAFLPSVLPWSLEMLPPAD